MSRAGQLDLSVRPSGARSSWGPAHTAAWIALQQHGGDARAAAEVLAGHWDAEPSLVRQALTTWIRALVAAGYLHETE
ncbi:PqqD family protein [Streptomyces sp. DSM 44915]|uniref:PqqD family protein n=1 Tax=Streptomyces chisholmiae TaxID=3075540 RepID=A0ABU2JTK1_9ACTN|nr:PqqD family protein [Streptomyces sp. DSM 44915]MDT0268059.1 PqqD family protein [Streptomyces sp. DSM 44915]